MAHSPTILSDLMALIEDRKQHRPPRSYTTTLFDAGIDAITAKIREEADELIAAAREAAGNAAQSTATDPAPQQKNAVIHEAADLLYHLLVLLAACDVQLPQVESELTRRQGISGLDEKAGRQR